MNHFEKHLCRLCGNSMLTPLYREDFLELRQTSIAVHTNSFIYLLCSQCGLVQVEPTPAPEFLERYYRYAPVAGLDHELLLTVKDQYYQETIEFLKRLQPRRIFEVGAASGYLLHQLAETFQATVGGLEPSDASRRWARNKYGIKLLPGMLSNLDIKAHRLQGAFDLVIACAVLEHAAWPVAFMRTAGDLLSKGGYIYIEVPSLSHPLKSELTEKVVQPFHLCYYTPASIIHLGTRAGLTCIHVEEIKTLVVPIYRALFLKQSSAAITEKLFRAHVQWFDNRLDLILEDCRRYIGGASNVWIWGIGDDFFKLWTLSPETFDPTKCRLVDRNAVKISKHLGPFEITPPDSDLCGIPDVILIASSSHLIWKNILKDAQDLFPQTPIHILYKGDYNDRAY
ncbi:MAG: methyltransferase domain-containing protein [Syntrophorhabdus aromaticivorans]|uniref:Methyltransferase domain-containing protein n=1 Tax=Syntrophorhabdus aromaticivorans TaxID=328301 RepID=A0A971M4L4_9BACT|nr:methyltransferase domain-containing protein [Syntrophorhabdus aromaticivorans]